MVLLNASKVKLLFAQTGKIVAIRKCCQKKELSLQVFNKKKKHSAIKNKPKLNNIISG